MNERAEASGSAFWRDADDTEARERYQTLVNAIDEGIYRLDPQDRFAAVNDFVCEMTGHAREELLGEHVSVLLADGDGSTIERAIDRLRTNATERSEPLELAVQTAGGGQVRCELRVSLLDAGDTFQGTVGTVHDISGRDRGASEREQELEAHSAAIEESIDGMAILDEHTEYVFVNQAHADIYGYDERESLLGEPWRVCYEDEEIDRLEGTAMPALSEEGHWRGEATGKRADGTTFPQELSLTRLDSGRYICVVRDVTERKERERDLRETRSQLEVATSAADVGLWRWDVREDVVTPDDQLAEAYGMDPEEATGASMEEFYESIHEDDREETRDRLARALEETGELEAEYRVRDGEGDLNWVLARGEVEYDEDGEPVQVHGAISDITGRKRAERKLREREQYLSTLVETVPECIKVVDADGTLVQMNPAGLEMIQADSESTAVGTCVYDLIVPEDRQKFREFNERVCRGESGTLEFDLVGLKGDRRHMESHAAPLERPDGTTSQLALTRDITDQTERGRELERALGLLEKTERIADVGGWEIDLETEDVFWSDHIFELLEVDSEEEPPLDDALDMYHEEDRPVVERAIDTAIDSGDPFDVEVRLRTAASGEVRWLRLQGAPEFVDGEPVTLRGAVQNVTERKQREQRLEQLVEKLEESNERLEQFAYAVSHDLQEPLRMVTSYLQMIDRRYGDELDEDGEEFIEFAVDGADRMREMIDGLLEYSRIDTRGDPFEPVDLDAVLANVRDDLQVRIAENDAEITTGSMPRVEGDGGQLRQLFQNLLDNAIEYSGDDPPRVHVDAERDGAEWVVSVRDEGIGIDPDDADRIFEVFQRLHTQDEHAGTGIGLALCRRIVEIHGGDIWVTSEPGEETTFSFTLPAVGDGDE